MVSDLAEVTISEAGRALCTWTRVHPGAAAGIKTAADAIQAWATAHRIEHLVDLAGETADSLLCDVADTASLYPMAEVDDDGWGAEIRRDDEAIGRLHVARNALIALRASALLEVASADWRRAQRPKDDAIDRDIPELPPLTMLRRRSMVDDEIFLCRLTVELALLEDADTRPVHGYVLGESGMRITVATTVREHHLKVASKRDVPTRVVQLNADGTENGYQRPLTPFATGVLRRTLGPKPSTREPLCYRGQKNHYQRGRAHAPVEAGIRRLLARAGVRGEDLSPGSLSLWRAFHMLVVENNLRGAQIVYGTEDRYVLFAALTLTEDESRAGYLHVIGIRDHRGAVIATVPTAN